MIIAIVGGTSFIGHAIAVGLRDRGHQVLCLHRGAHPSESGCPSVLVDRRDTHALRDALASAAPDRVIDTRAMDETDARGIVRACEGLGVRLIVLSSQDVYAQFGRLNGHPAPPPLDRIPEDAPLTVPYPFRALGDRHEGGADYDKKILERIALERGEDATIVLRLPAVYGARDPRRRFGTFVDALDRGERVLAAGPGTLRWTHADVDDVAHAVALACEADIVGSRVYNVGEDVTPTMRERIEAIAGAIGVAIAWREPDTGAAAGELALLDAMPCDLIADDDRIRRELGYREQRTPEARVWSLITSLRRSRHR
jgi:2'-hydroxyisoflavone reductase